MHSHDRTLLASLGFADPDKKNPKHTLACQYLSQPDVSLRLWSRLLPAACTRPVFTPTREQILDACGNPPERTDHPGWGKREHDVSARNDGYRGLQSERGTLEVPIVKGRDFLVGFWDVVIPGRVVSLYTEVTDKAEDRDGELVSHPSLPGHYVKPIEWVRRCRGVWTELKGGLYVEVKTTQTDVAAIARQLALYEMHTPRPVAVGNGYDGPDANGGASFKMGGIVCATTWPLTKADKGVLELKGYHHVWLGAPFEEWCKRQAEPETPEDEGL